MSDHPANEPPATNEPPAIDRLSLRAVLVDDGDDPNAALAEAGIIDPVEVPVVLGDDESLDDGILGDGATPNLIAVLETELQDETGVAPNDAPLSPPSGDHSPRSGDTVSRAPAAYGVQPLAPIRRPRR